jgi:hypothetical protein
MAKMNAAVCQKQLYEIYEKFEVGLTFLGTTAVEDEL